jgi:hypothetical protein
MSFLLNFIFLKVFAGYTGPSSEEAELDSVHDVVKVVHVDDEILRELSWTQSRIDQVNFYGLNPFTDKFGKLKLNKKKKWKKNFKLLFVTDKICYQ